MARGRDGAGNVYVEFDMSENEQIRITRIPHQAWADGPTIRIQKRAYTGRVSPGPEFPANKAEEFMSAFRDVTTVDP